MLDLNHVPASYLSQKYHSVDTRQLLDAFTQVGFNMSNQGKATLRMPINPEKNSLFQTYEADKKELLVNKYSTKMARYTARLGHEKHFMRLQSHELRTRAKGHDLFLRVSNSYDGSSSLKVSLDILRLVCLNGMVGPRSIFEISIRHSSKNIYNDAIEAAYKIVAQKEVIDSQIDAMSSKVLNFDEKIQLIDKMIEFRFGDGNELTLSPNKKIELLRPVRIEENTDNLYQNFNTLQEKLTRGSKVYLVDENGHEILRTVREVKSQVNRDTFNDNSWQFATSLAA